MNASRAKFYYWGLFEPEVVSAIYNKFFPKLTWKLFLSDRDLILYSFFTFKTILDEILKKEENIYWNYSWRTNIYLCNL